MRTPLIRLALVPVLGLGVLLAACGDDTTAESSITTDAGAAPAAFCAKAGDLVQSLDREGDPSAALQAAVDAAPGTTGEKLQALGEQFGAAAQSANESGNDAAFLAEDLRTAAATAFGAIATTCDLQNVELAATEYSFGDVPDVLTRGLTAFHLANGGKQAHEMLLYRRAAGTTGDLVDIVNEDPTVSDGRLEEVGVMLPAGPGEDSVVLEDLAAGDYVMVCFLQDGTTSVDQIASGDVDRSAKDHRSLGMTDTFMVG